MEEIMEKQEPNFQELYFSFKGRIPRSTFWLHAILVLDIVLYAVVLAGLLVYLGLGALVDSGLDKTTGASLQILTVVITVIAYLIVLFSGIALSVKRCHDRNRSGWFLLIALIPVLGSIWYLIELGFLPGTRGDNRFGRDPLQIEQDIRSTTPIEKIDSKAISSPQKHIAYKICNIIGMAVGIFLCVLCLLLVQGKLSFDRYHEKADQIYRVVVNHRYSYSDLLIPYTQPPVAKMLRDEFSEVLHATRFYTERGKVSIKSEDKHFIESPLLFTDSSFFDFFSIPLIKGDPKTALATPNSVVITRAMAEKYFGDKDPIGKALTFRDYPEYRITGVCENVPHNTHFFFDFLAYRPLDPKQAKDWADFYVYTYIMLPEDYSPEQLEKKFPDFIKKYSTSQYPAARGYDAPYAYLLQPLTDIYLQSQIKTSDQAYGAMNDIYMFAGAAILILLLTCLNYISLATNHLIDKTRESGIKKISGSIRSQLFKKLGIETFRFSLIALILAVIFTRFLWPFFKWHIMTEMKISLFKNLLFSSLVWVAMLIFIFVTGYLFIYIFSNHIPALVLKSSLQIFQFGIAMLLIINAALIYKQLNFAHQKHLEFGVDNVLVIPLSGQEIISDSFKAELLQDPRISNVMTATNFWSGYRTMQVHEEGIPGERQFIMDFLAVDYDFLKTLQIELIQGRDFSKESQTDESEAFIINEAAVRQFGMDSPLGKRLSVLYGQKKGHIIGVVKDYHIKSLHGEIEPTVIHINRSRYYYLMIRISPDDVSSTVSFIEEKFKQSVADLSFEYKFLEEHYKNMYLEEEDFWGPLFRFALLCAIFFTIFSVYSLLSYFIGHYRGQDLLKPLKVNLLLSVPFIGYTCLIGWSSAYIFMNYWMRFYAYRVAIGIWPFILATLLSFAVSVLVTLISGGYHAITTRTVKSD
jgi:putative ABC transport system permease protein